MESTAAFQLRRTRRAVILSAGACALAARMRATRPVEAAPAGLDVPPDDRLTALLRLVPAHLASDPSVTPVMAVYGDRALQASTLGVTPLESFENGEQSAIDSWVAAEITLAHPGFLFASLEPELAETVGFSMLEIDRWLEVGMAPDVVTLLEGRFAIDVVSRYFTGQGYQASEQDGVTRLDLRSGAPPMLGWFPDAGIAGIAVLDSGMLIAASTRDLLDQVLAMGGGDAASLAERADIASLLHALPGPLASAYLINQDVFALAGGVLAPLQEPAAMVPTAMATNAAQLDGTPSLTATAQASIALTGITPGGPLEPNYAGTPVPWTGPAGRWITALLFPDAALSTAAVPEIEDRLAHGHSIRTREPWAEQFANWSVTAMADAPVTVVDITFPPDGGMATWLDWLLMGDPMSFLV